MSEKLKTELCDKGNIKADNLSQLLKSFAKNNDIDDGSFEGKTRKSELNCIFRKNIDKDCKTQVEHYCGPHLKMYHDDKGRENKHMRIYFAWDKDNLDVVYIGMISSHVNN